MAEAHSHCVLIWMCLGSRTKPYSLTECSIFQQRGLRGRAQGQSAGTLSLGQVYRQPGAVVPISLPQKDKTLH